MDMVYTDAEGIEIGLLQAFKLDLAYGEDENSFKLRIPYGTPIESGSRCYIDDTEWGGIVRGFREDTTGNVSELYAIGQTWHGILAETIVCPPTGSTHVVLKGDANACIASLLKLTGMDAVFDARTAPSGITLDCQLDRFCTFYGGLKEKLADAGAKLKIAKEPGCRPCLYAMAIDDYSDGERALKVGYVAEHVLPINHLVCTGEGEMDERIVVHLYADAKGNVSQTQTLFGLNERTERYDYTSADEAGLITGGTKRLAELQQTSSLKLTLPSTIRMDVGDIVGIVSEATDLEVSAQINKVIVSIGDGKKPSVSYETPSNLLALYSKG